MSDGPDVGALVINYHYVHGADAPFKGLRGVTPERFAAQMATLARELEMVDGAALQAGKGWSDAPAVVTFDDGLKDITDHCLDVLVRHRIPAMIFLNSLPYTDAKVLGVHKVHMLQGKLGFGAFRKAFEEAVAAFGVGDQVEAISRLGLGPLYRYDTDDVRAFKTFVNYTLAYPALDRVLAALFEREFGDEAAVCRALYMSVDDTKRCLDAGLTLGVHTHSHRVLSRLDLDAQRAEIQTTADLLADLFGVHDSFIAYPNGNPGVINRDTVLACEEASLVGGFVLGRRLARQHHFREKWFIPRFDVNDVFRDGDDKIVVEEMPDVPFLPDAVA